MTSKERVIAAICRRPPDRIPIDLRFSSAMEKKLETALGKTGQALYDWLGQDVYTVRPAYPQAASSVKYADPTVRVDADGCYVDIYGVPFKQVANEFETYLHPLAGAALGGASSPEELQTYPWPTTACWDYSGIRAALDTLPDKAVWARSRGCFQITELLRGTERFYMDLVDDPSMVCGILDAVMAFVTEDARQTLEAGDGGYTFIEYNDDIASQQGMMISPSMWREFFKPRMRAFIDMVHEHGAFVKVHSCGSVYPVIRDFIEIGVDVLNPIQPLAAHMDPFAIKREFGRDICLHGGVDIQEMLPHASPTEVKEHVRRMADELGRDGGWILAGSHTIQADARVENITAMLEAVQEG